MSREMKELIQGVQQEVWDQQLERLIKDGAKRGVPRIYWSLLKAVLVMTELSKRAKPERLGKVVSDLAPMLQREPEVRKGDDEDVTQDYLLDLLVVGLLQRRFNPRLHEE